MCETKLGYSYDDSNDGWDSIRGSLARNVLVLAEKHGKLFKTNVEGLWEDFINSLPENAKQFYTCNACKHFIERFGGLVAIDEGGNQISIWEDLLPSSFFLGYVNKTSKKVQKSKVVDVFVPEEKRLGFPKTGQYTHFYAELTQSMVHKDRLKTAYQKQAEHKENFKMVTRALLDFDYETAKKALVLVESSSMYRSDKVLGVANWFKSLHQLLTGTENSKQIHNLKWKVVEQAPEGFCHIRSSMIGTLLEDIQSGMSTQQVKVRFEEKMNPSSYGRSQSAPTAGAIVEAEKLIEKLGYTESLERKYATLDDVKVKFWDASLVKGVKNEVQSKKAQGVFADIQAKDKPQKATESKIELPTQTMTWEKFLNKVLPTAVSVEALVDNTSRLMALVTAKNPDAPNMLQWDNPVSWYYSGGIDGEMKERVENAGGRYEDNEIRATLMWDGYTDLDLHCEITPVVPYAYRNRTEAISYSNKRALGGYLDVDANGGSGTTQKPVENIRFVKNAPNAKYKFIVHNFSERVGRSGTAFVLELEIGGKKYTYNGDKLLDKNRISVFEFNYQNGQVEFLENKANATGRFDVNVNEFKKVNVITTSPNLWGKKKIHHTGEHIFFLLDDVKDESEGVGRGFFNEMLVSELREIRKTLEAFTANSPIDGVNEGNAFGLGFTSDNDWNLTLKVTTTDAQQLIKIDRWD